MLKNKGTAAKLVAPKAVTIGTNILRMGPRVIFRSTVELLRANLLTRILSCVTILLFDIIDLARHRISKTQFIKNVILSVMLLLSGTLGWQLGSKWIVLEMLGGAVEIIGGLLGAGLLGFASNLVLSKVGNKIVEPDSKKMLRELEPYFERLPPDKEKLVRNKLNTSHLKQLYASKDKEICAHKLIDNILKS
jgi:hypothetical protein